MFGLKKKDNTTINTSMINTIIGSNTKIEGILTASESARIDGTLVGKVLSERSIIVGESGTVKGDISAVEILVAGIVYGNLIAQEKIELTSTGRVVGSVTTKTLVIDEGAAFKGTSNMEILEDKNAESKNTEGSNVHTPAENSKNEKPDKGNQEKRENDLA